MSEKERISMNNYYRPSTSCSTTSTSSHSNNSHGGNNGQSQNSNSNQQNHNNGRKLNKNNRKKYSTNKNHRHMDENELNDFHNLVSWRGGTTAGNSTENHNSRSHSSTKSSSSTTNAVYLPHKTSHHHHHHLNQQRHHHQNSHHEKFYPESKSNYHLNYNKIPSYSFSIELTEYDFEEINQNYEPIYSSNCLDDELEIYLKSVYAKSEAALDLHAQHLALAAERSKQTATERWLLSRTPEERHRYLQNRNMATQF